MSLRRSIPVLLFCLGLAARAETDKDHAECRAAHPGKEGINAYIKCLDERERQAKEAEEKAEREGEERLLAALPMMTLELEKEACANNYKACARVEELEAQAAEGRPKRAKEEQGKLDAKNAKREAELAPEDAAEAAKKEARTKSCGKAYGKPPRVGMAFSKTFQKSSGPFILFQERGAIQTWEAPNGTVHVQNGKFVAWSSN